MNKLKVAAMGLVLAVLTGCGEATSVTLHEPGVYMGASDPLLSADAEKRASELNARFNIAEIDR